MPKYSTIVFNSNPQVTNDITLEEEALVRKLFADLETAWDHPALQGRLRRTRNQVTGYSTLNGMTLFSVIWSASKKLNFQSHQVVWNAMRVYLENDGVLAELVTRFNESASTTRKGKAVKPELKSQMYLGPSREVDYATSSAFEDVERRQEQRRTRRSTSSSTPSTIHRSTDNRTSSSSLAVYHHTQHPQTSPINQGSVKISNPSYSTSERHFPREDQGTFSRPSLNLHPDPFSSGISVQGQMYPATQVFHNMEPTTPAPAMPDAGPPSYPAHRVEYERSSFQEKRPGSSLLPNTTVPPLEELYPGAQFRNASFEAAPGPPNLNSDPDHYAFPSSRSGFDLNRSKYPYSSYPFSLASHHDSESADGRDVPRQQQ
ncbi:hypothetical protein F5890DRAFT_1539399 [Lentinula detonsa]|uniref:Uncharacterized protein n=1 Tax=Lentinula detonsa TaxID=2804962 RepID=A0AA38PSD4_9AGAR|nr:hypothetical protein F5890DRAFT_1539399 [Lentinula detonsa]